MALRWSGAQVCLPVIFALGSLHAVDSLATRSGYPVNDVASSSYIMYIICPLLAGLAAYGMRGWARFHSGTRASRLGVRVFLNAWWPLLVGGPVAVVAVVLLSSWTLPLDRDTWSVLAVDALTTAACILFGLVCGWALPSVAAAPLAASVVFVWISYLPSTGSPLLHHLTPTLTGCCAQSVQPSGVVLRALFILTGIIVVALALLMAPRRWSHVPRPAVLVVLAAVVLAAFGSAALSVKSSDEHLLLTVGEPRTTPLTCTTDDGVRVCLWPEGRPRTAEITAAATQLNEGLARLGLPRVQEISNRDASDAVTVESTPSLRGTYLTLSLASGYVRWQLGCPDTARQVTDQRVAFLALTTGGATKDDLRGEYSPEDIEVASSWADRQGTPEAAAWFLGSEDPAVREKCGT